MTAAKHKSSQVTALETQPIVRPAPSENRGNVRLRRGKLSVTTAMTDDVGDVLQMVRMGSRDVPLSIKVWNTDLDSNGAPTIAVDVGIYQPKPDGTATVLDADAFASAITTLNAAADATEIMHEDKTANPITDRGQAMWELAGLTADDGKPKDIAFTLTAVAATGVTGTIVVEVLFIEGA